MGWRLVGSKWLGLISSYGWGFFSSGKISRFYCTRFCVSTVKAPVVMLTLTPKSSCLAESKSVNLRAKEPSRSRATTSKFSGLTSRWEILLRWSSVFE